MSTPPFALIIGVLNPIDQCAIFLMTNLTTMKGSAYYAICRFRT